MLNRPSTIIISTESHSLGLCESGREVRLGRVSMNLGRYYWTTHTITGWTFPPSVGQPWSAKIEDNSRLYNGGGPTETFGNFAGLTDEQAIDEIITRVQEAWNLR